MSSDFAEHFPLRCGRTHEVFGANALAFALALAGQLGGQVMWISERWRAEQLNPAGFKAYIAPENLLLVKVKDQAEGLAVAEEALRSGALKLVVIEVGEQLSLLAGRRLQLAAETGKSIGLCMISEGMGSNAAQTRWHCTPVFDPKNSEGDSTLQRWEITKNKSGTIKKWKTRWDAKARRVIVVCEAAQR